MKRFNVRFKKKKQQQYFPFRLKQVYPKYDVRLPLNINALPKQYVTKIVLTGSDLQQVILPMSSF